ncbi:GDSL esterase/lipase [Acorus calamus]|uniref:GDSL esterase/lipase n=1 Tax=Acorus calamus TaxID=4465 RepID=A0AAV9CAB8_ACOCL|nr:GDSL esterase/lipase [Acorus calamus]
MFNPDDFSSAGPKYLSEHHNWEDQGHRRSVMACLVQGVYSLRRDQKSNKPNALAPPWWTSFGFSLRRQLIDDADSHVFGAIYERSTSNPKFVIAFRGTTDSMDVLLDWKFFLNRFHKMSRCRIAIQAVSETLSEAKTAADVWLAGHSLGAVVAISAAKHAVRKRGLFLETYLFNSPYPSLPIEGIIKNEQVKFIAYAVKDICKVVLAKKKEAAHPEVERNFKALAGWVPWLFVNSNDVISREYKEYFEHRKKMEAIGLGKLAKVVARNTLMDLYTRVKGCIELEPMHLLPSATLVLNPNKPNDQHWSSHKIQQWWLKDLDLQYEKFTY